MNYRNHFLWLMLGTPWLIGQAHGLLLAAPRIDSSAGDPLYAEIPFSQAQSRKPVRVSIAQTQSGIQSSADTAQTQPYNFYVRQNEQGAGIIVVTSTIPMDDAPLDLTLRIEDDQNVRYQQLQGALPSRIDRLKAKLNESRGGAPRGPAIRGQDVPVNLPVSGTAPPALRPVEQPLLLSRQAPPPLGSAAALIATTKPSDSALPGDGSASAATGRTPPPIASAPLTPAATSLNDAAPAPAASSITKITPAAIVYVNAMPAQRTEHQGRASDSAVATASVATAANAAPALTDTGTLTLPVPASAAVANPSSSSSAAIVTHTINQTPVAATPQAKPSAPPVTAVQSNTTPGSTVASRHRQNQPPVGSPAHLPAEQRLPHKPLSSATPTVKPQMVKPVARSSQTATHTVKANDSLWKIASMLSRQTQQPVSQVMRQIRQQNPQAFIGGNPNLLRQGVILNIPAPLNVAPVKAAPQATASASTTPQDRTVRQQDAHLSIVGSNQGSAQGNGQGNGKSGMGTAEQQALANELTQKRLATLKMQQHVSALDQRLAAKKQRIALLNRKLANIQQQLQQQQSVPAGKPTTAPSSATPPVKSQSQQSSTMTMKTANQENA